MTKEILLSAFDELAEEAEENYIRNIENCIYLPYKQVLENNLEEHRKKWIALREIIEKN